MSLKCKECGEKFYSELAAQAHVRDEHDAEKESDYIEILDKLSSKTYREHL